MQPVLPAFTGHVPRALAPTSTRSRTWQTFGIWALDRADPFIEMIPVETDPAAVAAATLAALCAANAEAVWIMQAWPFSYQREYCRYGFGDCWGHNLIVEKSHQPARRTASRPEDTGGPEGFEQLLRALRHKKGWKYHRARDLLGGNRWELNLAAADQPSRC